MILRQWGGSSQVEPLHLFPATNSKNTNGAGRIFHLRTKCFLTLFFGLKGEVPALMAGPLQGGGGRRPTCQPSDPYRPSVGQVAAPPSRGRGGGGCGRQRAPRSPVPGGSWAFGAAEQQAPRAPRRPRRPRPWGHARAHSFGARARGSAPPSLRAPCRSALLPHPRHGRGGSSLLPSPRAAAAAAGAE